MTEPIPDAERRWLERVAEAEDGVPVAAGGAAAGLPAYLREPVPTVWSVAVMLLTDAMLVVFAAAVWVGSAYLVGGLRTQVGTVSDIDPWVFNAWYTVLAGVLMLVVVAHVLTDLAELRRGLRRMRRRSRLL